MLLCPAGCRDNPRDKAAKEVHQQIQAALGQSDALAAQQQVQSALSRHRPVGPAQDSAQLVSGNLAFNHSLSLMAELPLKSVPVRTAIENLAERLNQSQQWLLEKERIEKMLTLQDLEVVELKELISGTAARPGLQERLNREQAEMDKLMRQRQVALQEREAVQAVIDDYQTRSETLLKQADLERGDQKLRLQQQAYALQLQRKDDYVKAQEAENKISILDDQIALVKFRIESLENNLLETKTGIESIEASDSRRLLKSQMVEIDQLLSEQQKMINENADAIKAGLTAYRQAVQDVVDILERTTEQYQRIRSGDAALPATVRLADSCAYTAMAYAQGMMFSRETAERLTGIIEAFAATDEIGDETFARGLAERLPLSADFDPEQFRKIMDLFEQADRAYEEALTLARRIPDRGREAAASVLNSHLLAIQTQMQFADALAQYDAASKTQERLEELKQQAQGFGSLFTLSDTARLLEKGLAYTPALPVNIELYFEGIRQRFTEWKRLTAPQEQAAAVEQNFAEMEELIRTYGEEMSQLLEPLRQEMLAAQERGFAQPVAPVAPTPFAPGEPNSFR